MHGEAVPLSCKQDYMQGQSRQEEKHREQVLSALPSGLFRLTLSVIPCTLPLVVLKLSPAPVGVVWTSSSSGSSCSQEALGNSYLLVQSICVLLQTLKRFFSPINCDIYAQL